MTCLFFIFPLSAIALRSLAEPHWTGERPIATIYDAKEESWHRNARRCRSRARIRLRRYDRSRTSLPDAAAECNLLLHHGSSPPHFTKMVDGWTDVLSTNVKMAAKAFMRLDSSLTYADAVTKAKAHCGGKSGNNPNQPELSSRE